MLVGFFMFNIILESIYPNINWTNITTVNLTK